jgi:conjugal transfer pilus assembly protein TraD
MTDKYEVEVLLRPPVELCSALVAAVVAGIALVMPDRLMMTPSIAYLTASVLGLIAMVRLRQAWSVIRYQQRLKRTPRYRLSSSAIPVSASGLFLGRGFRWTQRHTERLYAVRDKNAERYIKPHWLKRVIRQKEVQWGSAPLFKYLLRITKRDAWWNPLRPDPPVGGDPALHGVGIENETDVFMPLSERPGHTAIIARTRHGKTRLAEILITQDIHRQAHNNVVIVFDPKNDADLLKRTYIEAKKSGRELIVFHLGYPAVSARYNAIGSFSRITEVAGRIASSIPGEGDARAFKEFAWQYVNVINVALFALGERPDYLKIRRYISDIDPLLVRYACYWLDKNGPSEWKVELGVFETDINTNKLSRSEQGRELKAVAIARYIKKLAIYDPILEGLISAFRFEREYFQKITAAVKPLLEKLTTGNIAEIISPNLSDTDDKRPILNWQNVIRQRKIVYVGLDALADPEVAEVVGESMFSDLTSLAARLYKHGVESGLPKIDKRKPPNIVIHADEFSDLIGPQFKTFINKSGGAGFELTLYTQTWSDPIAELGDVAKAGQLAGNIGTMIMMGVKEITTCEMMTQQLPEVNVSEVMSVSGATDAANFDDGITFVAQNQDRISVSRVPMISPADIVALPKGQAFALLNGGELWKIRIPLPHPSEDDPLPDDLGEMLETMRDHYSSITDWDSFKSMAK